MYSALIIMEIIFFYGKNHKKIFLFNYKESCSQFNWFMIYLLITFYDICMCNWSRAKHVVATLIANTLDLLKMLCKTIL